MAPWYRLVSPVILDKLDFALLELLFLAPQFVERFGAGVFCFIPVSLESQMKVEKTYFASLLMCPKETQLKIALEQANLDP